MENISKEELEYAAEIIINAAAHSYEMNIPKNSENTTDTPPYTLQDLINDYELMVVREDPAMSILIDELELDVVPTSESDDFDRFSSAIDVSCYF